MGKYIVMLIFRDVNRAFPKDYFLLLDVGRMVDATTSHERFSFMDGFSGYNYIKMAPKDEEKTTFRTPIGNFFYMVMLFDLKNVRAT